MAEKTGASSSTKFRYYMVTFDLVGAKGREAEYEQARKALQFMVGPQNYIRIVKQCCFVRTDRHNAARLRDSLQQMLGSKSNILVVRLRHGYAFRLMKHADQVAAANFLQSIPAVD